MWDSHCHLTIDPAKGFENEILVECRKKTINLSICSVSPTDAESLLSLKNKYEEHIYHIGLHPWFMDEKTEVNSEIMKILNNIDHFDGIGEVGLDFSSAKSESMKRKQIDFLEGLLSSLEKPVRAPVVYHCVKAHHELLSMPTQHGVNVLHGFYSSKELAKRYLDKGFYFSLGHLYLNGKKDEIINYIPRDRLLLETDSPGKVIRQGGMFAFRNPLDIEIIYDFFSEKLGLDRSDLEGLVKSNIESIYKKC